MSAPDRLFIEFQTAVSGRYSLERELGRGGMGVVYLAREVRLDRLVAIKVLPPELGTHASLRERFLREARTAAQLSHPHIVQIFAVDEAGPFVFYAMAYVDGDTLGQRLTSRGALSSNETARVMREVAWALGHAHARRVVHRDVKPANILLDRSSGRALVADFGIARVSSADASTSEGERLGTPEYMSPEQCSGDPVDARSDIYSLGVVGFVAASGRLPFSGESAQSLLAQHVTAPAPPVSSVAPGIRHALAAAIDRCLLKSPDARWQDASLLADSLAETIEAPIEVPVQVRMFIDPRRATSPFILGFSFMIPAILWPLGFAGNPPAWIIPLWLMGIPLGLLIPFPILGWRLRQVLRAGYGPADLARPLRAAFRQKREEFRFEHGASPGRLERLLRALTVVGAGLVAAVVLWVKSTPGMTLLQVAALVTSVAAFTPPALAAFTLWRQRSVKDSFGARFWESRIGRWAAKVAGVGLKARAIPADRPTEVAIAMSAEALFKQLPAASQRQLAEFPDVLARLQERARLLRERIAVLDESHAGDLRDREQARLTDVVSALETLRLDLLRHSVGAMTLDGVTADLTNVRELGREAERLIEAKREVERAVRPISPRPT